MKTVKKTILLLSVVSSIFILTGCSSKDAMVITDTANMEYVENPSGEYGVLPDPEVDARIVEAENFLTQDEIDPNFEVEDPSWTTKLVIDPDAVTADKIVEKPPVITYKYKFDKKFYDKPRWRSANE